MKDIMDSPLLAVGLLGALIVVMGGLFLVGRMYGARQVKSDHDGSQEADGAGTIVAGDAKTEKESDDS